MVPWYIAQGRPVRKNPNGRAGIIQSDVPSEAEYVGVQWSDGHASMQPVGELIRWEPNVGDLVVTLTGSWVDTVLEVQDGRYYFARVAWPRFLHELRPRMQDDVWFPVPGEQVRIRDTDQVGIVRPPWHDSERGHRVDLGDGGDRGDRKYLPYQLAPVAPMREV
jgi:hypothetical protein